MPRYTMRGVAAGLNRDSANPFIVWNSPIPDYEGIYVPVSVDHHSIICMEVCDNGISQASIYVGEIAQEDCPTIWERLISTD